ncbi:MAG: hypothetical protein ACRDJC_09710 [Thermomicrobiales bacterium]
MDRNRFAIAARAIGRRGVLKGFLVLAAAHSSAPADDVAAVGEPCAERGPGERCRNGGQCCSNHCRKKRGKRTGRCRCSALRAPCAEDRDCCGFNPLESGRPVCDVETLGVGGKVCCLLNQAPCESSFDCCSPFVCDGLGFCRPE